QTCKTLCPPSPRVRCTPAPKEFCNWLCCVEIKQAALALDQGSFNGRAVRIELVKHAIQPVVIDAFEVDIENVDQRGAPHPIRHGVFGGGRNQSGKHHRTSELAPCPTPSDGIQKKVRPEALA